ncbi:proton extrusion protein PcxA [Leptolyngbya sp. BL0902]|uniref:proton extrusion protein PcxA n=1 Tax=Leptolyngbya sp. BL0902 TaxID=1115757 RepID=UPI0018E8FD44|nr:proton extrusion protein PcxA [Leptolyngbya sp. BL0902]QQE63764.1 proton extrusion protein PcxA [Leptolyngbya sp. BL0902]
MQTPGFFRNAQQWFFRTPERALNQAYEAAQMIEAIEREYFGGNPISARYGNYGDSAMDYFQAELKKYLNLIKVRMAEFRTSRTVIRASDPRVMEVDISPSEADEMAVNVVDRQAVLFRKLRLIDAVLARYASLDDSPARVITLTEGANGSLAAAQSTQVLRAKAEQSQDQANASKDNREGLSERVNVLPRSILRTVDRIRQDLDPNAEEEVMREFRTSKGRTTAAIRFLLLLIIVPLLTHQFTKTFLVGSVVDHFRQGRQADVFLNIEMEEEALHELQRFEERLRFEVLIGKAPPLSELNIERQVREKATEIEEEYRQTSANAIKNIFADLAAVAAFMLLLITRKQDVANLKAFMDEMIYGLSDSAKAFIIILFTDIFVGFHSPHGWEVLLEGFSRHFGFPANREFIFLFIATFPVVLNTVFKYWIFRYLNRISPSAVATYKNMNE